MNLYRFPHPLMIDSGTFWRCHHGHTMWNPCLRCGLWHPLSYIKHVVLVFQQVLTRSGKKGAG